jgi:hypothetical protein
VILREIPSALSNLFQKPMKLLYRGSRDGFRSSDFHSKVDDHSNTVTIVETTIGFVFGGSAPCTFSSTDGWKSDDSLQSFLFTVKNPHNLAARKFSMNPERKKCVLYCEVTHNLLWLGESGVIGIMSECNTNNYSHNEGFQQGGCFINDTGLDGPTFFTGERKFTVKEIETFELTE